MSEPPGGEASRRDECFSQTEHPVNVRSWLKSRVARLTASRREDGPSGARTGYGIQTDR